MNQRLPKVGKTISYLLAPFCYHFHSLMAIFIFSYLRDLKFIVNKQLMGDIYYLRSNFDQIFKCMTGDTKCHKGSYFIFFVEIYFYQFS